MITQTKVRDLMTSEAATLNHNEDLALADRIMTIGRIRHMPVLDDEGLVVGILSQRDLFFNALLRALGFGEHAKQKTLESLRIKDCMTDNPITIGADEPLARAAEKMSKHKIGCLPVVDDGKLVGILTESDFVKAFAAATQAS